MVVNFIQLCMEKDEISSNINELTKFQYIEKKYLQQFAPS